MFLSFITKEDLTNHIIATIKKYGEKLTPYNLKKFNSNIIDPIKLIFDKSVYGLSWEEIIKNEIFRQRDKSNNNDIGYFHQRIFKYFKDCEVPLTGWDVIYKPQGGININGDDTVSTVYIEMKNKHNTMNSSSSARTYIKMQNQLLSDDDCACCLVEAIAKHSQNIKWQTTNDGKRLNHRLIRRMSLDKFYELVTGEKDAFYKLCMVLPELIDEIMKNNSEIVLPKDTVIEELNQICDKEKIPFVLSVYMLGYGTYNGFV
ncbi:MAG: Eco47II family restriction endonuclease [Oscillospiraceae bacterium]|jgi:hypothetical protein|nr:Eco47II family restriction endonuclease [Oscillospiraceae bacterium]